MNERFVITIYASQFWVLYIVITNLNNADRRRTENMKSSLIVLVLALLLGLVSCKSTQIVQPQPLPVQQLEQKKPDLWLQDTYPAIDPSDPVTFYNEFEIVVRAEIPKTTTIFKDGNVFKIDTSTVVTFVIPAMTPGILVKPNRPKGVLSEMIISFNESDENYNCSFVVMPTSKAFTLNANMRIMFEGKPYLVKAAIKGDGSGLNRLRVNFFSLKQQNQVNGSATGRNASGTKIIAK
jgi:hypothetical protein